MCSNLSQRAIIIGLDGATFDLIHPWANAGYLPNLAYLMREGSYGELLSTIPPMSPSAWTSFMTGKNPGKHGIFDFTQRAPQSYRVHITTRTREATLWKMLSQQGRRVCVVNVPQTYPPESVNGIMVTGLGTPAHAPFTFPPDLGPELESHGYRINPSVSYRPGNEAAYLQSVFDTAEKNTQLVLKLLKREPWDFFMTVLRLTDEIPHFFWRYMDSTHPDHVTSPNEWKDAILNAYRKADDLIGRLIEAARDAWVIILSDHGFGPLYKDVFLNEWLRQGGFLVLKRGTMVSNIWRWLMRQAGFTRSQVGPTLSRLKLGWLRVWLRNSLGQHADIIPNDPRPHICDIVDWRQTRAYSMGYIGQVYLNVVGRDPEGAVSPEDYEAVRIQVAEHLMKLKDEDGSPVVDRIIYKEEVCHGPYTNIAPDLFVLMRDLTYITRESYDWSERGEIFTRPLTGECGGHRIPGILIAHGPPFRKNNIIVNATILDITPTVLYLLGCPIPADLDGNVLLNLLVEDFYPKATCAPIAPSSKEFELTPSEEAELMQRLRDLGYVG